MEDEGLDMEVEFTDDDGRGTGKTRVPATQSWQLISAIAARAMAQRSSGSRSRSWVKYWMKQEHALCCW